MTDVGNDMDAGHIDDNDDCSLFGSPPPSPVRGRSPSPLAFPSGSSSAQNVGTLALPGSHYFSELPVNPPAHPSCTAPLSAPPRPGQALSNRQQPVPAAGSQARMPFLRGERSRSSSTAPSIGVDRPKKQRKAKERVATPRPTPPPIPLPDPSEPPPPNFLRNQQALLGLAGLVSGVNPSQLSTARHSRGSTPQNPIVLDDSTPASSYSNLSSFGDQPASISRRPSLVPLNPSQLPSAPSEDVLATLIGQRNIFPVIESLLRLVSPSSQQTTYPSHLHHLRPPCTGFERPNPGTQNPPPLKRRKLTSVPAGAADWDVPYPFAPGQGPADYQTTWARERARRLLADLLALLRNAVQKAATKAHYRQDVRAPSADGGKGKSHYRPETFHYGSSPTGLTSSPAPAPNGQAQNGTLPQPSSIMASMADILTQPRGGTHIPTPASNSPTTPAGSMSPFDQLVTSLLAASSAQQQSQPDPPTSGPSCSSANAGLSGLLSPPSIDGSDSENTPPYFDEWLALLNAYPPGDPSESATSDAGFDIDSSIFGFTSALDTGSASSATTSTAPAFPMNGFLPPSTSALNDTGTSADDFSGDFFIDPILRNDVTGTLAFSPRASPSQPGPSRFPSTTVMGEKHPASVDPTSCDPATPTLVGSPRTSASEYVGPPTPEGDFDWGFGEPDSGVGGSGGSAAVVDNANSREGSGKGKEKEVVLSALQPSDTSGETTIPLSLFTGVGEGGDADGQAHNDFIQSLGSGPIAVFSASQLAMPVDPKTIFDHQCSTDTPKATSPSQAPPAQRAPGPFGLTSLSDYNATHPHPHPSPAPRIQPHLRAQPGSLAPPMKAANNRATVVERGRVLRSALASALERAKVELWETTLEQGVLVHLTKDEKYLDSVRDGRR